jgi:hypothetical protein
MLSSRPGARQLLEGGEQPIHRRRHLPRVAICHGQKPSAGDVGQLWTSKYLIQSRWRFWKTTQCVSEHDADQTTPGAPREVTTGGLRAAWFLTPPTVRQVPRDPRVP